MRCNIELLDSEGKAWFSGVRDLPSQYILDLASKRKPAVMEKGLEFAQGAIPYFGGELVKVLRAKGSDEAIDKAVIEFALATVVVDSCLGVSDEVLLKSDFNLVVYGNGTVRYDRLNAVVN